MSNYCTLFDSNYLTRGLAMYESLKKHSSIFHLYIFAFDDKSYKLLKQLDLEFATIIALNEFEDDKLLSIKSSRSAGEYCWTCTPSTIKYCIETYNLESCTYLDADLFFFSNPEVLIKEMGNKSVLISEHRYTKKFDQSEGSGIYCVQFMTFKNDLNGMKVLNWWQDACNEWCYARHEDGKFGDQKYLDDWTTRFDGVHVLRNLGGGVAPWNVGQYQISQNNGIVEGVEIITKNKFEIVFYHFHNFKFVGNRRVQLGAYDFDKGSISLLYKPYVKMLKSIDEKIKKIDNINDYNGKIYYEKYKEPYRSIKRLFINKLHIYATNYILEKQWHIL